VGNYFRIKNPAPKIRIIIKAVHCFLDNDLPTSAAAISYFTMLMLFPMLIVLLSLGESIFGYRTVRQQAIRTVLTLLPGTSEFVRLNVEAAMQNLSREIVISGTILVLWASSWIFSVIEKALNRIWRTTSRPFLHGRLLTLGMSILLGIILIASASITTTVAVIKAKAEQIPVNLPPFFYVLSGYAWQLTFIVASLIVTIGIFTLIYRFMPNAKVSVREALPGAIFSGVLWEIAKYGFAWLVPYFHYNFFYGPIGLAVALLTWIYISSILMLFGAQLTALLHVERLYTDEPETTVQPAISAPQPGD
jgi:YihY family inner membrane protein